jgi:hypothetical protein
MGISSHVHTLSNALRTLQSIDGGLRWIKPSRRSHLDIPSSSLDCIKKKNILALTSNHRNEEQ